MVKKILIVLVSLLALTGCFGRKAPKIDFGTPTKPDIFKLTPNAGPNDAAPAPVNPVEPPAKP